MFNLKSIKLYFFSILKLTSLRLKIIYYKSSFYNKSLITAEPSRIFYTPSSFLIAPLVTMDTEIYQITNISPDLIWKNNLKNNIKFENLHSFLWLAKIDRKADSLATQSIIDSWIDKHYNYNIQSWDMKITAKRIIAWASNSDIALHKSDNIYKKKFFLCLIKQSNFLLKNIKNLPIDSSRIVCTAAIILSGLIFKEETTNLKSGIKELEKIVSIYFDKSGFPKSRNPEEVLICIKYLILVREWFKEAQELIPEFLNNIILKCGQCYSFLTNSHKKFPLFNGATEVDHKEYDKLRSHKLIIRNMIFF